MRVFIVVLLVVVSMMASVVESRRHGLGPHGSGPHGPHGPGGGAGGGHLMQLISKF